MLIFVSQNEDKIDTAKRNLLPAGIEFKVEKFDFIEIQSESIEEISISKAKQAFKALKQPLFVSDHGWSIPALNGFPGPYMKYMNNWLTTQDFLNLIKSLKDKRIILTQVICYIDKNELKTFTSDITGKIITKPKGEGLALMKIVTFLPSEMTVAQCIQKNINSYEDTSIWKNFSKFIFKRKLDNNK